MTIKWPALKAVLEPHTVEHHGGRLAGFLVRCTSTRKELGYVWPAGSAWRWQTPDRKNSGERSAQRAAVEVLRDAYDLAHGVPAPTIRLPFDDDNDEVVVTTARPRPPLAKPLSTTLPRSWTNLPPMKPRRPDSAPPPQPIVRKPARFHLPANSDELQPKKIDWSTSSGDVTAALEQAFRDLGEEVMSKPTMRDHAYELAKAFDARIIESDQLKPEEAFAVQGPRLVICAPIKEKTTYAVYLHELGHLASPTGILIGVVRTAAVRLDEERAAWEWARHYALEWDDVMESVARFGLSSYERDVQREPPAPPPAPVAPPPHINWEEWK